MKKSYFLSIIFLSVTGYVFGAACSSDSGLPCILAVGGQNTLGSEVDYVSRLFNVPEYSIIRSPLPQGWLKDGIDLGQEVCMKNLATVFPAEGDVVFHATSQGTATTLNYVATLAEADQRRIKMIVLEAVLASGNSAIMHNAKQVVGASIEETPGCGYSAPYCATSLFPRYSPSGKQAIKSIEKIAHDIPIVIIHAKKDACLPFSDACALYYGLRSQGHENVYFMECEGGQHVRILERDFNRKMLLRKILAHHEVFEGFGTVMSYPERIAFQPDIERFRAAYERLRSHERSHSVLPWAIGGAVVLAGACKVAAPSIAQFCESNGIDSLQALLSWIKPS